MTNPTYSKFNQLLEDPSFVLGASILGNTGQPNVVGSAMQNMANINNMKRQRDLQAQQLEQAKAAQQATAAYQQGSLQNETDRTGMERERTAAQAENYKSEAALRQSQVQAELRKQAMQENFFKAIAPQFGLDPAAFMQQQQGGEATPQGAPQPQENGPVPGTTMGPTPPASMPGGMRPRQLVPLVPMLPGHGHIEPLQPAQDTPFQGMTSKYMQRTNGSDMAPYILNQESGNRSNVGQSIDGAVGPGQMLPATFQRFARPGESISNPNDNRAVSARYLDYLAAKAAGDPAKVAAGYFSGEGNMGTGSQPFKRDVADGNGKRVSSYVNDIMAKMGGTSPTGYTARVLAGADLPPAKMSGIQAEPQARPGMKMAGLGALGGMMGIPGAAGLIQYGQMQEPKNVPAGSYQMDADGKMTYVGDPLREESLNIDRARLGNDNARVGLEGQRVQNDTRKTDVEVGRIAAEQHQQELKLTKEQSNDTLAYRTIQDKMGNLGKTVDEIMKSPGLGSNAGWKGALHVGDIPGTEGHDTQVKLENLKSRVTIEVMSALKQASATGSTGFGQLSEKEGETLRNYLSNLDKAQTERSLKEALGNIKDFSAKSAGNYKEFYKNTYGKLPDAEQQQSAPAAAPAGLPTGWKRIQ